MLQTEQREEDGPGLPHGVRQMRRAKRTDEILAASIQVFAREGYAGFSLRKVAAAAGVRLNTVQHYFGDLDSMLLATVRVKMAAYVERYQTLVADERLSARDRFEALLDDAFAQCREPGVDSFFFEAWALGQQDGAIGLLLKKVYADYYALLSGMVRQSQPQLSESEAAVLAALIGSWTEGALIYGRYGNQAAIPTAAVIVRMKAMCMSLISGRH